MPFTAPQKAPEDQAELLEAKAAAARVGFLSSVSPLWIFTSLCPSLCLWWELRPLHPRVQF